MRNCSFFVQFIQRLHGGNGLPWVDKLYFSALLMYKPSPSVDSFLSKVTSEGDEKERFGDTTKCIQMVNAITSA